MTGTLRPELEAARLVQPCEHVGRVVKLVGLVVHVRGLRADRGELVRLHPDGQADVDAEVVGFFGHDTLVMALGRIAGIGPGTRATATGHSPRVLCGRHLLGRVVDGLGRPLDQRPLQPGADAVWRDGDAEPPHPLARQRISERLALGVRALDSLVPCGQGQRLGIFAGSGVGKSSLMGMIARNAAADVNVICLVGERGREVKDFLERDLGEDGLARSVVVCATSDQPALVRIKAALAATAIAEHFRDEGLQVILMMDSVTRLAMAQREVGLAAGEMPATRAYPPSTWAMLPQVLERAGAAAGGSITALYTVLVEGDDMNEPVADAVRAILDGHVVLDRALAHRNHYPAIDVLASVSRLERELLAPDVRQAAAALRETLARYREKEDLVIIGAYQAGGDPGLDYAVAKQPDIDAYLRQPLDQPTEAADSDRMLIDLMADRPAAPVAMTPAEVAHPVADAQAAPVIPAIPQIGDAE